MEFAAQPAQPVLYALTAGLYGALARRAWIAARDAGAAHAASPPERRAGRMMRMALFLALLCHGVLLHETVFRHDSMVFGFAYALSAMLWLGAATYWIESFFISLDGIALMLLPSALVASMMPLVFGGAQVLANPASGLFKLHFVIANMAYGLLALAAFHALLMLLVEQRLHLLGRRGRPAPLVQRLGGLLDAMPPLLALEKLLFRLIALGFLLLTLTMVSGVFFAEALFGKALRFDHKTVFAVVSWLMFGALLTGRALRGWRGRTALRWVLASFAALLLAYVGSRFVIEVLLHRVS